MSISQQPNRLREITQALLAAQTAHRVHAEATQQAARQEAARLAKAERSANELRRWANEHHDIVASAASSGASQLPVEIDAAYAPVPPAALTTDARVGLQNAAQNARAGLGGIQAGGHSLLLWKARRASIMTGAGIAVVALVVLAGLFLSGRFIRDRVVAAEPPRQVEATAAANAPTPTEQPAVVVPGGVPVSLDITPEQPAPVTATATLSEDPPTTEPVAEPPGRIVFQSNRDGDYELYLITVDGSGLTQLTHNTVDDRFPRVSPDGRQIVFQSRRNNNSDIYLINLDGSNERRLTVESTLDELPSWAPDGQTIIFNSWLGNNSELFTIGVDGTGLKRLTDSSLDEAHAAWGKGGRITFNGTASGESFYQIYTANPDMGDQRKITDSRVDEYSPEWSPDGRRILFVSERGSSINPGLYIMNSDGSDGQLLYNGPSEEWGPVFSADGRQVAFTADQPNGTANIYLLDVAGGEPRLVTERGGYPSWVPDGLASSPPDPTSATGVLSSEPLALSGDGLVRLTFGGTSHYTALFAPDQSRIYLSVEEGGGWQVYEADPNGGGLTRRITNGPYNYYQADFLPDGSAFLTSVNLDGDGDIWLIDAATGESLEQLTNNPGLDYQPRLLPDDSGFIFSAEFDGDHEIYRQTWDGDRVQLTNNAAFDGFAAVSADGRWITFYSSREESDYEIYLMGVDGSDPRRLTYSPGRDASPTFSPDGRWVVFESARAGGYEIYAVPFEGGQAIRLTDTTGDAFVPVISPDGRWLMYQSTQAGEMDIYRQPWTPNP